jgi:hypothetical protein
VQPSEFKCKAMKYRKLRIAWSVGWGAMTALLIVLWAMSNVLVDYFRIPIGNVTYIEFISLPNDFAVGLEDQGFADGSWHQQRLTDDWLQYSWANWGMPWSAQPSFFVEDNVVYLPYWLGVLLSATLAITPLMLHRIRGAEPNRY